MREVQTGRDDSLPPEKSPRLRPGERIVDGDVWYSAARLPDLLGPGVVEPEQLKLGEQSRPPPQDAKRDAAGS